MALVPPPRLRCVGPLAYRAQGSAACSSSVTLLDTDLLRYYNKENPLLTFLYKLVLNETFSLNQFRYESQGYKI